MDELNKTGKSRLVSLLHGKNGEISIPKPFERDIFLFDTYVQGPRILGNGRIRTAFANW